MSARATAVAVLIFGISITYLAAVLRRVYREYPEAGVPPEGGAPLSTDRVLILFSGVLMLLLGWLLIPVSLGMLPFSGSAQLGLLMVLIAIKMLASGDTPFGSFTRSWAMISLGMLLAALGIISCIIPDILVMPLMLLIGLTNVVGGTVGLWRTLSPLLKKTEGPRAKTPPILVRLSATQLALNVITILFGLSTFLAGLIPGPVLGVILAASGAALLYMLRILVAIDRLKGGMGAGIPVQ